MTGQVAVSSAAPDVEAASGLEQAAVLALYGVTGTVLFSIAVSQSLLAVAVALWLALVVSRRERIEVPRFFWALAALGGWTLLSAAFSPQPRASLADSKQLLLFLIVPLTYRIASGARGHTMITVLVSAGAATAALGIFQYGLLHYDLQTRPRGTLGHWMTYSGLVMLVIGVALSRLLFDSRERLWAALVMPALAVGVAVTFTRNAWVGACLAAVVLFSLKDFRLLAVLPVVAAVFLVAAPSGLANRLLSIFDVSDPTNRDRVAMLEAGRHMVQSHPVVGVGPAMVEQVYPSYRAKEAVEPLQPHLHNVPLQLAAERGLPAAIAWLAFVGIVLFDLTAAFRTRRHLVLTCAAIAAMVSMLAAGLFEHNFGDSEFLMLLLLLITLPFAALRSTPDNAQA
jgi:O-antigen ligase